MTKPGAMEGLAVAVTQSWRDIPVSVADFAFETDRSGRFAFIAPDPALGWPAAALLGQPAELLLSAEAGGTGLNPFRPLAPIRAGRAWLRRSNGSNVCLSFAAAPLTDEWGHIIGARGIGFDVTEDERRQASAALSLRRLEVLDDMLWRLRQEVLPPQMIATALSALTGTLRAAGVAIIRVPIGRAQGQAADAVRHHVGADPTPILQALPDLLGRAVNATAAILVGGTEFLVCPCHTRFRPPEMLVLWRPVAAVSWTAEDGKLAVSATALIRLVLEHEAIQQEMARQTRNDPLTGLCNRAAFLDELERRVDRLERERLPGTLLLIDLDDFGALNQRVGLEAGDAVLCALASLLRHTFRPADLLARMGNDGFAVWLDGADELAAAERAEALRLETAGRLAVDQGQALSVSIAIGTRWPGSDEEIDMLLYRVDQLLGEIAQGSGGQWRVSRYAGG